MKKVSKDGHIEDNYYARARAGSFRFLYNRTVRINGESFNDCRHTNSFIRITVAILVILIGYADIPLQSADKKPTNTRVIPQKLTVPSQASNLPSLSGRSPQQKIENLERARRTGRNYSRAQLIEQRQQENDPIVRMRINQALSSTDSPQVVDDLIASLQSDPDDQVRKSAAQELARYLSDPAALQAVSMALDKDPSASVQYDCALVLSLTETSVAVEALNKASRSGDPKLRQQVAYSLRRHHNSKSKSILNRLKRDRDNAVRTTARAGQGL